MKHIEVSKKISLSQPVEIETLRSSLIDALSRALEIEEVSDVLDHFRVVGTTGSPAAMARNARLDLRVDMALDADGSAARVIISGYSRPPRSLMILYTVLFIFLLLVGLLPGFIETNAEKSGAIDALVFLIFGIYMVTDVNKKLAEPSELIEAALNSLDTTFG